MADRQVSGPLPKTPGKTVPPKNHGGQGRKLLMHQDMDIAYPMDSALVDPPSEDLEADHPIRDPCVQAKVLALRKKNRSRPQLAHEDVIFPYERRRALFASSKVIAKLSTLSTAQLKQEEMCGRINTLLPNICLAISHKGHSILSSFRELIHREMMAMSTRMDGDAGALQDARGLLMNLAVSLTPIAESVRLVQGQVEPRLMVPLALPEPGHVATLAPDNRAKSSRIFADPKLRSILRLRILSSIRGDKDVKFLKDLEARCKGCAVHPALGKATGMPMVSSEEMKEIREGGDEIGDEMFAGLRKKRGLSKEDGEIVASTIRGYLFKQGTLVRCALKDIPSRRKVDPTFA